MDGFATLPAATDVENTILGAELLDSEAWHEIAAKLLPIHFSPDSHHRIAAGMGKLRAAGTAVDIVTLAHWRGENGWIESVGGVTYLASLTEGLPCRCVIADYIDIRKKWVLREAMKIARRAISPCRSGRR